MARLYADENVPFPTVAELRRQGHDVLTALDAGQAGRAIPDVEVLNFALRDDRAVLTLNRKHFIQLHAKIPAHAGIVVITTDSDFVGQARRIDAALASFKTLAGSLIRVNRPAPGRPSSG